MRVLVTGGTGKVGQALIKRLVRNAWDVRVIGLDESFEMAGVDYRFCDMLNYQDLQEQVQDCQRVIHLAAFASPTSVPGPELYKVNTIGTYNVFEAAAQAGIRQIVQASSINAFGCFWGNTDISPQYLPLDEAHPTFSTDPLFFFQKYCRIYWGFLLAAGRHCQPGLSLSRGLVAESLAGPQL